MDQNDQQNPQPPVQNPSPTQQPQAIVESGMKALWNRYGILFVFVGALLLIAKFGNVMIEILGTLSKKDVQKAQKEDSQLKAQEDTANQQADELVKKANELSNQETQVDDNWDKKK